MTVVTSLAGRVVVNRTQLQQQLPMTRKHPIHWYPLLNRRSNKLIFALWCAVLAALVPMAVSTINLRESKTDLFVKQTSELLTSHLNGQRKDQVDPCSELLEQANTCIPLANPTCSACVETAFDTFLSTITTNFTCTDFEGGVCPIVYNNCMCAPCNTELESYFNCILNDVSNNECPVAYCDPLKDFSLTPEACQEDLSFASSCIGADCLQCLGEMIDTGADCDAYGQATCDAINIDCMSCLSCRDAVEPWLRCIGVEGKSCPSFECAPTPSPASIPSLVQQPSLPIITAPIPPTAFIPTAPTAPTLLTNITTPTTPVEPIPSNETSTTTSPSSAPQSSIVNTPVVVGSPTAAVVVPASTDGQTPTTPGTTRDVVSMGVTTTTFSKIPTTLLMTVIVGNVFIQML